MKKIKQLSVSTPQGASGLLERDSRYVFNYTTNERKQETSLLMPIRAESYGSGVMLRPFTQNMPEGYLKYRIEERFAPLGGIDEMMMLAVTGCNQIGRLQFKEVDVGDVIRKPQIGKKELLEQSSSAKLFDFLLDAYLESGISGVQPKVMIPDADKQVDRSTMIHSDLIVKTSGDDYPFLAMNEFLCMSAAKEAGISVAPFWLSDDGGLFVMERFDLNGGAQLGFEDMTVVMDKSAKQKYESSYESVARAISIYCHDDQRVDSLNRLFEYLVLSTMVRNGDAHLKNFGLLYEQPNSIAGPSLSPLYDVVTTSAYELTNLRTGATMVDRQMALKLDRKRDYPTRDALLRFGRDSCLVKEPELVLERIDDAMQTTLRVQGDRVESVFLRRLKNEWDGGRHALRAGQVRVPKYAQQGRVSANGGEPQTSAAPPDIYEASIAESLGQPEALVVSSGLHSGSILNVENGFATQQTGRHGETAIHDVQSLSEAVVKGNVVDIRYTDGVGLVAGKNISVGVGR